MSAARRRALGLRAAFPEVAGLSPEITAGSDHCVVNIDLKDPVVEAAPWTLEVRGLVQRPAELAFEELQRRVPLVEEYSALTCVSNELGGSLLGSSRWTGVRLRNVLAGAGVQADAVDVVFTCADGYTCCGAREGPVRVIALRAVGPLVVSGSSLSA